MGHSCMTHKWSKTRIPWFDSTQLVLALLILIRDHTQIYNVHHVRKFESNKSFKLKLNTRIIPEVASF